MIWLAFVGSENSLVIVEQEETLQAMCEKINDSDQKIGDLEIYVDRGDIPVLEHANTETHNDDNGMQQV